jgi:hypothetical protein
MSTPPPLPDDSLELSPRPPKRSVLAKLAAILAAISIVAFGLCTNSFREDTAATVGAISGSIAVICFVALIVVGFIAIFRSRT